jgi:hypothetical protein
MEFNKNFENKLREWWRVGFSLCVTFTRMLHYCKTIKSESLNSEMLLTSRNLLQYLLLLLYMNINVHVANRVA